MAPTSGTPPRVDSMKRGNRAEPASREEIGDAVVRMNVASVRENVSFVVEEETEQGVTTPPRPESPILTKSLFAGTGDSSSEEEEETVEGCAEKDGGGDGRRPSYRDRSRRLSSVRHPARVTAPEVAYVTVTPVKSAHAAARRQSMESRRSSMGSNSTSYDSPLPTEVPGRSPMKRGKVPFPELYSPVPNTTTPLRTPLKASKRGKTEPTNVSMFTTLSTWSPWESPPAKIEEPIPINVSFKSPIPPTPLKRNTPTPSRQRFLNRKEVLVRVEHPAGSQEMDGGQFDELETTGWLGAGVSAEVLKVYSARQKCHFAVKKTKHELRSERERDLLLQEIKIAATLAASGADCKHIVRYYQAWQADGYLYIQTEYCAGGNLRDFVSSYEGDHLPEDVIWTILHHVCQGLDVLHSHRYIHLDVKPENVFITAEGKLKLGDLGTATGTTTKIKGLADTEGDAIYMAKELLSTGERKPSADIFSLGIMMLELATKIELPASGDLWHALRGGNLPPFPSEYSSDLATLIAQMMSPDPLNRPSATNILFNRHVQPNSAAATVIVEHARSYSSSATKKLLNTSRSSCSETPRKPRMSISLFSDD